jgi:hypothetical protein
MQHIHWLCISKGVLLSLDQYNSLCAGDLVFELCVCTWIRLNFKKKVSSCSKLWSHKLFEVFCIIWEPLFRCCLRPCLSIIWTKDCRKFSQNLGKSVDNKLQFEVSFFSGMWRFVKGNPFRRFEETDWLRIRRSRGARHLDPWRWRKCVFRSSRDERLNLTY